MDKSPINDLMDTTMQKVREMIDANTIVGDPIRTEDGVTLIPISKLSFGFAGGGADGKGKEQPRNAFGGGIGAGVKVDPVAFIVVKGENIRMLHISTPARTTVDKILETAPEIMSKITDLIGGEKQDD